MSFLQPIASAATAASAAVSPYATLIATAGTLYSMQQNVALGNQQAALASFQAAQTERAYLERKEQRKKLSRKEIKVTTGTPDRTDGNLLIQQLGSSGSNVTNSFSNTLGRFGIITRDTGDAFCSQLAQDLYDLYKPTL